MTSRSVTATRRIEARPERIFALLVDATKHPLLDGSSSVKKAIGTTPARLGLRSRFTMDMHLGVPYRVRNTVVEFDEGRRIAWTHIGGGRWRWELAPTDDDATVVTETFDWSKSRVRPLIELFGFPARNQIGIDKSLERLASLVKQPLSATT